MFDLKITNELSNIKNKKLNILQIGFYDNNYTKWLLNNLITNNNSKLYILNIWYQSEKNSNMINDKSMINFLSKDDNDKYFFKDLKNYMDKILNIKEKSEVMFKYFKNIDISFELILINLKFLKNPLLYIISCWEFLKNNGILILLNTNKEDSLNDMIETFIKTYGQNIEVLKMNNIFLLKKKIIIQQNIDIPIYIYKIFNKFLQFKNYDLNKTIPNIHMNKIIWEFKLGTKKYDNNLCFNYEIEKYYNYVFDLENTMFQKIKKIDINLFLVKRPDKFNTINNTYKIDEIIKYWKNGFDFKLILFYKNLKILEKKKKINLFIMNSLNYTGLSEKFFLKYKNIYCTMIYSKINNNIIKNKNFNYLFINNKNLFDINNILYICKNLKKKQDVISLNLTRYISKNNLITTFEKYGTILVINILYLILNIQNKKGDLKLILPFLKNNVDLEFLQILKNYYHNLNIETYFNYSNYLSIIINANDFKGISNLELNNFYNNYDIFYKENLNSNINNIFLGKKIIQNINIENIISNKINKNIKKIVCNFNKKYYKEFLINLKIKIDIYEFLKNKLTNKKQKDYIYNKLFQIQYKRFIEEYKKYIKN